MSTDPLIIEQPFTAPVQEVTAGLRPAAEKYSDIVTVDWPNYAGTFKQWKLIFGAEGSFKFHANPDGSPGGVLRIQVDKYRGITEAKIRETLVKTLGL